MIDPNGVKFVTIFKIIEIATTFYKKPNSFEAHRNSYSRWKKGSFDFNFEVRIHQTSRSEFIKFQA